MTNVYRCRIGDVTLSTGEDGTVSESGGRLAEGTTLYVTATPAEGHHFVQWSDGVTDNPRSVVVGKEEVTLLPSSHSRPIFSPTLLTA